MKIVILPGLDGTGHLLETFAHELEADHDVEVISYPVELTSYAKIGDWLRNRLPHEDFAIVAESFSGPLAIQIANRNLNNLRSLVLVATFARSPRRVAPVFIGALKLFPYFPDLYMRASLPFVVGRVRDPSFLSAYRDTLAKLPVSTLIGRLQAVLNVDVREMLGGYDVPTAYIRAAKDLLVPNGISAEFSSNCVLFQSIDAPHFALQTKPQEAARIVLNFLEEQ